MNVSSARKVRQVTYTIDSALLMVGEEVEERTETETYHNNTLPSKACVTVQLNA